MNKYAVIIVVAVIILFVDEVSALRCRICRGAEYLDSCHSFDVCTSHELCYLDYKVTDGLDYEYWGGCRSRAICESTTFNKSYPVACSQCCSRDDCNTALCGLSSLKGNSTTKCLSCPQGVDDPDHCYNVATCPDDQLCFSGMKTDGFTVKHVSQCYRKEDCKRMTIAVMRVMKQKEELGLISTLRRDTDICDICCGGDLCNSKSCMTIRGILYALYKHGRLNNDTLTMQLHDP